MVRTTIAAWIGIAGSLLVVAGSHGQAFAPTLEVTSLTATDAVHPGGVLRIALQAELEEGWHTNSHEPLDEFLIPTTFTLEEHPGAALLEVVYPEPQLETFAFSPDEPLSVFEREFVIGVQAAISEDAPAGDLTLAGRLRYQACDDRQCAPPATVEVEIPIRVAPAGEPVAEQHTEVFSQIAFSELRRADALEQTATAAAQPDSAAAGSEEGWEALAEGFEVAGIGTGYMRPEAFIEFIGAAEAGERPGARNLFEGKGALAIVGLILVGGLLLNLTPCVLPLIPVNLAIIGAGAVAGSRAKGFALGAAYGVAIAATYGILGLIVVMGGGTFGAINASPWFNLAIAAIFAVLALAMFDKILIDFTRFQSKLNLQKNTKGSFAVAFFMGGVSALLAGACVAPVLIAVLLLSQDLYVRGSGIALGLPFLLGAGMALPWPFAGAGLSFLPKPGMWMTKVKYAFGVLIAGFAAYYGYLGASLLSERFVDKDAVLASVQEADEHGWVHSLAAGLEQAEVESKPVLIDFWATWCKSCMTMNNTTLKEPDVLGRLDGYVKIKYQAEDPGASPAREIMQYYGVQGLPTYIVLQPKAA